jgi:tRNA threonylcarbamoyladenosine biosynthesis protein TsaE
VTLADVKLRIAQPTDAALMSDVIRRAFTARPPLDPPAAALADTQDDVRAALTAPGFGVIAEVDGAAAGCLLVRFDADPTAVMLRRVSVAPEHRHLGVASLMVRETAMLLADRGVHRVALMARGELPHVIDWWADRGYAKDHAVPHGFSMARTLPRPIVAATDDDMRAFGRRLAHILRAGDLVVADGPLGAGKTTLAQGLAAGLGVDRPVISPTFVLSRVHPSLVGGPRLVHADAYRLGSAAELDDLDLDASADDSVTYVEWGAGLAEGLAGSRLDVDIARAADPDDLTRTVYLTGVGPRWAGVDIDAARDAAAEQGAVR